jgi:hypothetical protein
VALLGDIAVGFVVFGTIYDLLKKWVNAEE